MTANNVCGISPIASLAVSVTAPLVPSVTIAAAPGNVICLGASVTFTPTPVNGGATPAYQWKKNGTNVATGATYTTTGLANGDVITAVMTGSLSCANYYHCHFECDHDDGKYGARPTRQHYR